jgi:hypothetical protein
MHICLLGILFFSQIQNQNVGDYIKNGRLRLRFNGIMFSNGTIIFQYVDPADLFGWGRLF